MLNDTDLIIISFDLDDVFDVRYECLPDNDGISVNKIRG